MRIEAEMNVRPPSLADLRASARQTREMLRKSAFELRVHAVVGHERAIVAGRERRGDRVRLVGLRRLVTLTRSFFSRVDGGIAERADQLRAHAEARGLDGGDDGAAADRRGEAIGLDLFAELGEAIEADEDQVFKRLTGAEQLHRRLLSCQRPSYATPTMTERDRPTATLARRR